MASLLTEKDALAFVRAELECGPARADVEATIGALDPRFGEVIYTLGSIAVEDPRALRLRCVAVLLQFAAVQLADDLADGDCGYLDAPDRTGPGTQWLLQHLSQLALGGSGVETAAQQQATRSLLRVGAFQQVEVRAARWDARSAGRAAAELNGQQYAAYLTLLWANTRWQHRAGQVGACFGFCLHVATDRLSRDRRWGGLGADGRASLLAQARAQLLELRELLPAECFRQFASLEGVLAAPVESSAAVCERVC